MIGVDQVEVAVLAIVGVHGDTHDSLGACADFCGEVEEGRCLEYAVDDDVDSAVAFDYE
ncbi:MAG: hypothetical protein ACI8QC_003090 [Planctomycetota bacterium]|jgi:hypothetical protein